MINGEGALNRLQVIDIPKPKKRSLLKKLINFFEGEASAADKRESEEPQYNGRVSDFVLRKKLHDMLGDSTDPLFEAACTYLMERREAGEPMSEEERTFDPTDGWVLEFPHSDGLLMLGSKDQSNCLLIEAEARNAGGMGRAYRAFDTKRDRVVLVKQLRPELVSQQLIEQMEREARLNAGIEHPRIAKVYDVIIDKGDVFIVFSLVRGQNTMEILEQQGLFAKEDVVKCIVQVAELLDLLSMVKVYDRDKETPEIVRKSVVHRDVKPSNIMKTPKGDYILLDFGLAETTEKLTREAGSDFVFGTFSFMSLEQYYNEPLDSRADTYGLAATAYHLLMGTPPFRRDSSALESVLREEGDHQHVTVASMRDDNKRVVAELEQTVNIERLAEVFDQGLAKDKRDRFYPQEFARALEEVLLPGVGI